MMRMTMRVAVSTMLLNCLCLLLLAGREVVAKQPNIVFFLTDDQDVELFGQYPLSKTKQLIADKGMTFTNMFVTSPLCCPSRSSIFTGKFLHNHNARNNSLNGNCSSPAWQQASEPWTFPPYLKQQGYNTFFAGKYLNTYGFPKAGGVEHIPPGWDDWNGLVGNSVYYGYTLSVNGKAEVHGHNYATDYLTDVIHRKAMTFLSNQDSSKPFFMMMSTPACHAPFTSAPQFDQNFTNAEAPRTKHFNIHGKNKQWLIEQAITPMPQDTINTIDDIFRNRWRTLLSVDDMVEGVINTLDSMGELDNTYVFYSSDNGFHLGQFSMPLDKRQLYDFDIRVPLMVRGPGVKASSVSEENVMGIDLAPTFLDVAGAQIPSQYDGMSIKSILEGQSQQHRGTILVEYRGEHGDEVAGCPQYKNQGMENCNNHCVCEDAWNNTYNCIRRETATEGYKYCALHDDANFIEVYDIAKDPFELENIAQTASPDLLNSLRQELAGLTSCSGTSCHALRTPRVSRK